ncbi:uroporphyrinogen-III synthase [uncultured Sphingomonas sp.]|uniref:uroporphyrinogen-III synthase n=1 Tax=uncultured Sphingomonas sp. TaxID=158754 RepID=UPI0035CA9D6A
MSRPVAILRPEPGNAATAARVEASGWTAIRLPLFEVHGRAWQAPDPAEFDALVLTSANAARHAGAEITKLAGLPVLAVGIATADAAREAGLHVSLTGTSDAASLLADARAMGVSRALHLAGRDRLATSPAITHTITVYASDALDHDPVVTRELSGAVALLHSPRAARRLAELADAAGLNRSGVRLAALSAAVARAAGAGWDTVAVATTPDDASLLDAAQSVLG